MDVSMFILNWYWSLLKLVFRVYLELVLVVTQLVFRFFVLI